MSATSFEEKWVMLHFHISHVKLTPDSFYALNYACWTIIFKALIFNQVLNVVNFVLKGRWSTNETSFKSHLGRSGSYLYCQSFENKLQREILIIMPDTCLSLCVPSQMIPRLPCISETTRVGPSAVTSNNCCCSGC